MLRAMLIIIVIAFAILVISKKNLPNPTVEDAIALALVFFFLSLMSLLVIAINSKIMNTKSNKKFLKKGKK